MKNNKKDKKEIVNIYVDEIDELFNKFDREDISDDLASYIEKRCSRAKNKMIIKVHTKEMLTDQEKTKIVDAIRSHFGLEIKYLSRDNESMNFVNEVYFIIGVLVILIDYLFPINEVINEIIDILGWFIIWESSFNLFFTDNEMDRKIDYAKKIIQAKVIFEKRN